MIRQFLIPVSSKRYMNDVEESYSDDININTISDDEIMSEDKPDDII